MRRESYILYGCVPLKRSGSGFLICGVPFEQIDFQISDLANPLQTKIHRITDQSNLKTDHWISDPARDFGKRIRNPSLCTADFTRTAIVVVSSRNVAIFLPVLSDIHQKIDQMLVNYK